MNLYIDNNPKSERSQVAAKTAQILMLLADYGTQGVRLKDLAEQSGIARPTVHRILQELAGYHFVRQLTDKKYALGNALFHLGLSAPQPVVDTAQITAIAQKLSDDTGDTCYVAMQSFSGVHYLVRTSGSFPIRAQTVSVGERKPYTASYCGLALLAVQDESVQQTVLSQLQNEDGKRLPKIKQALQTYHQQNMLYGAELVLPDISGMACTVPVAHGRPFVAVSISAIESRLTPKRANELLPKLQAAAAEIGQYFLSTEGNEQ